MNRLKAFIPSIWFLLIAALPLPAQAQIFTGATINSGTEYDSQGLGIYNLSRGSLTLDGSSVFGGETTIYWAVPSTGGVLEFKLNVLTASDGALSISGSPITFPNPFTLSNATGTLAISGSSLYLPNGNTLAAGSVMTISSGGSGYVILGPPFSISNSTAPEPSTSVLVAAGMGLLYLVGRRERRA